MRGKTAGRMGRPPIPEEDKRRPVNFGLTIAEVDAIDAEVERLADYCYEKGIQLAASRGKIVSYLIRQMKLSNKDFAAIAKGE